MQCVGHHLQVVAITKFGSDRDLFARSAYNRYYYAVFLTVRGMVVELDPKWKNTPHKTYPDILAKNIAKRLKSAKTRANRIGDHELIEKLDTGIRAAMSLSKIIEKAYGVRIVADYEPSEAVDFTTSKRFSLKSVEITEAHEWEPKALALLPSVRQAWKQLDD